MGIFSPSSQHRTLLIAGTDTDVGKTVLTSILAAYWQAMNAERSLGLIKLLQTGIGDDEHYQALFACQCHWDILTPLKFDLPLAPPLAAERAGKTIDLALIWKSLSQLQQKHNLVLVEALGSLGSPVTAELTVADIAGLWHLDTLLVVPVKLGCLGQAIAQVTLARQCKVAIKGIILSCRDEHSEEKIQDWANPALLEQFTHLPMLGIIPHLKEDQANDLTHLAQIASNLNLERL